MLTPNETSSTTSASVLLTVAQTAAYLHVSTSWVRRHLCDLPVIRMGAVIRVDSDQLQIMIDGGKPLKPKEPIMANRFQRGTWKVKGKKKMVWGTFRLEERDAKGERIRKSIPLGLRSTFSTESAIQKKLDAVMDEVLKPGAVPTKVKKYSTLAEEWKATEGRVLGRSTLKHYNDALRAYILPTFADTDIKTITRKTVQDFLTKQAESYSKSSLRSMRNVLCMTLKWAEQDGVFGKPSIQPNGWLEGIRLPRKTNPKRTVIRTELRPEQTLAIVGHLKEPYSTLVLFVASLGRRIEEAVGLQPADLSEDNVLYIRRIIYDRQRETLEDNEVQVLPLDAVVHADLLRRIRKLGEGHEWVFRSRAGTPVNPGNALRRYLHPATKAVGVRIGGWHDFRHTLTRMMRRGGENQIVMRDTLSHKRVQQQEGYDVAQRIEVGNALRNVGTQLAPTVAPNPSVQ